MTLVLDVILGEGMLSISHQSAEAGRQSISHMG